MSRAGARLCALLGLWLLSAWRAAPAQAAPIAERVLVVVSPAEGALALRLAAELESLALTPVRFAREEALRGEALLAWCHEQGAGLALGVERESRRARLVIADRTTGKVLERQVSLESQSEEPEALIALSAVELLHASLLELKTAHARGDVPATAPLQALAEPERAHSGRASPERSALSLGFAVSASPHGVGPLGQLRIGAEFAPRSRLALTLTACLPVYPQSLERASGGADVWSSSLWLGAHVPLLAPDPQRTLGASLGAGVFGTSVATRGHRPEPGLSARESRGLSAGPSLEASVDVRVSSRLGLRLDGMLGFALSRLEIFFGEARVARVGQPLLVGALSLRVTL
ncbi:MAG: hypothetical protein QM778_23695 [Myxococcales bacterium]